MATSISVEALRIYRRSEQSQNWMAFPYSGAVPSVLFFHVVFPGCRSYINVKLPIWEFIMYTETHAMACTDAQFSACFSRTGNQVWCIRLTRHTARSAFKMCNECVRSIRQSFQCYQIKIGMQYKWTYCYSSTYWERCDDERENRDWESRLRVVWKWFESE